MAEQKDGGALLGNNKKTKKVKPLKHRDEDCCSVNFLKCVLHIFNVVFLFAGLGVLGVGAWTLATRLRYARLLSTPTYPAAAGVLAAAGALAAPLSALGCCGLKRENRTGLLCYTYFLLIVFFMEAGAGSLAYFYEVQVERELQAHLNNTFLESYNVVPERTKAIDDMQMEFRCCGALRFDDWRVSEWLQTRSSRDDRQLVPDSCCKTVTKHCGRRDHPSNIHNTGCIRQFTNHIRDHLIILAAVGLGMSVIPIFGFIFSCCLYVKIKHVID